MQFLCYHWCRTLWLRKLLSLFSEEYLHCSGYHLFHYNYQIRFFSNSGSDIINEVICCCSRMTSHFHWIIARNFSPIYILGHRIAWNKNFFLYRWAICRLSFNQVTIIAVFICCCFSVLFIRGGLFIGVFISIGVFIGINSMIIRLVISYTSVYTYMLVR